MQITIDTLTANDPQQAKPAGWCPLCGAEICGDAELCLRCQNEMNGGTYESV